MLVLPWQALHHTAIAPPTIITQITTTTPTITTMEDTQVIITTTPLLVIIHTLPTTTLLVLIHTLRILTTTQIPYQTNSQMVSHIVKLIMIVMMLSILPTVLDVVEYYNKSLIVHTQDLIHITFHLYVFLEKQLVNISMKVASLCTPIATLHQLSI